MPSGPRDATTPVEIPAIVLFFSVNERPASALAPITQPFSIAMGAGISAPGPI